MRLPHWGDFEPDEWIVEARGEEDAIEISSEASAGGNDPEGASASPNIDDKIQLDVWSKNVTSILSEARLRDAAPKFFLNFADFEGIQNHRSRPRSPCREL